MKELRKLLRETIPHLEFSADMASDEDWNPNHSEKEKEIRELILQIKEETKRWNDIEFSPVDLKTDVHTEHCCIIHGCKYGDENCSVETKFRKQSFPCEACFEDDYQDPWR